MLPRSHSNCMCVYVWDMLYIFVCEHEAELKIRNESAVDWNRVKCDIHKHTSKNNRFQRISKWFQLQPQPQQQHCQWWYIHKNKIWIVRRKIHRKKWFDRYYKLINRIKADWLGLESICMATVIGVLHVRGWKFIWRSAIDWKLIAIICIHRACTYFPHTTANGSLVQLNCKINYSRWFFNLLPRLPSRLLR